MVARFGPGILLGDGSLDRAALRRLVLADPVARQDLEAIVHPAVRERRDALWEAAARDGVAVVVQDIPLLFEASDPAGFDLVVLVDAPETVRRARLIQGRGLTPGEADRLIASQMPAAAKRTRSHIVIDNDADRATLEDRARAAWRQILASAQGRA
jgi:dephospho-CoA kinase